MAKKPTKKQHKNPAQTLIQKIRGVVSRFWRKNVINKIIAVLLSILILFVSGAYGISQWYMFSQKDVPLEVGVTFIPSYARYLDVDPKETFQAILDEMKPTHVRLVSYWNEVEQTPGVYDFSQIDWQFDMAEKANAKVSLAIGLRQPRWPECHMPEWQLNQPKDVWYPELKKVMAATVERYKSEPSLESYQLENEFFLSVFGECPDFSRDRLIDEYNLVKSIDPDTKLIISRSNNAIGFPINEPQADEFGVSIYKRVWDRTLTKRYVEYPFPAWFYGFLAGGGKILTDKNLIIHELQAEAWTPDGFEIKTAPVEELYKSMNPDRLKGRFEFGQATGMKRMDLWGAEWWYAMKVNRGEPELWEVAKEEFRKSKEQ